MRVESVAHSNKATVGHAGLPLINERARISGLDDTTRGITSMKQPQISDTDILRNLCGPIAQGKIDFDHIREFAQDSFLRVLLMPVFTCFLPYLPIWAEDGWSS